MQLLTQNSDLKKTGIFSWTLPAHIAKLPDGTIFKTCPQAGICAGMCYAKNGTYLFPKVKEAHLAKLKMVLDNPEKWYLTMLEELSKPKYSGKFIRIHDSGDFFAEWYAELWLDLAKGNHNKTFYAYTKEVAMFKRLAEAGRIPDNFIVIFSYGGNQDHLINPETDRHSDVFPDYDKMIAEGYNDIADDDKQAAINPNHKVGLFRNNIPAYIKRMGERKFSSYKK